MGQPSNFVSPVVVWNIEFCPQACDNVMQHTEKSSSKRRRGVILSDRGLAKIQEAKSHSEYHENGGERYTTEALSEKIGLDPHTLSKVFNRDAGVDKQTLHRCFSAFHLTLEADDYLRPQNQNGKVSRSPLTGMTPPPIYDNWGEVPDLTNFCGRVTELDALGRWVLVERCRLVVLLGRSGIGKTFLAAKLAEQVHLKFTRVVWRSLSGTPPIQDFLAELIRSFPERGTLEMPNTVRGKISELMHCLRTVRCLLVLDGAEAVLQIPVSLPDVHCTYPSSWSGNSLDAAWYRRLLRRLGTASHSSCAIVTARQEPQEVKHVVGENLPARVLRIEGLTVEQGQKLFDLRGAFEATPTDWQQLIEYYDGHPLFLKIAANTILKLFNGNIAEFLRYDVRLYGDIRKHLDEQFQGLSEAEWQLLCCLARQSGSATLDELRDRVQSLMPLQDMLEALENLEGRTLIEKKGGDFCLGPVMRDYAIANCQQGNVERSS